MDLFNKAKKYPIGSANNANANDIADVAQLS
jgi:hypothetical protein